MPPVITTYMSFFHIFTDLEQVMEVYRCISVARSWWTHIGYVFSMHYHDTSTHMMIIGVCYLYRTTIDSSAMVPTILQGCFIDTPGFIAGGRPVVVTPG